MMRITMLFLAVFLSASCYSDNSKKNQLEGKTHRNDKACKLHISESGSLQNPAWSPDGETILFTRFSRGYNKGPAELIIYDSKNDFTKLLVSDGSGNINLPGSVWNPITRQIVFSSSREPHDEIYIIDENGNPGDEIKITNRKKKVAYEPSFSPDGQWVVFESHKLDVEGNGIITKYKTDKTEPYQILTGLTDDCRQPNWSPAGNLILYQKRTGGQWDIWVMDTDGKNHTKVTNGRGNKTDAAFSPNGQWIVYSSEEGDVQFANLFVTSVLMGNSKRLTYYNGGYDGAPSWSPDGRQIVFESCPGDPDRSSGTSIWMIEVFKD